MASSLRVLIVEDRPDDAELLVVELRRAGYAPRWSRVDTLEGFVAEVASDPHVILCDYSLPAMTAPDALAVLRDQRSDIPLIVVSGVMDEETCVNSLRLGAVDYLLKDRLVRLGTAVEHALAARRLALEADRAERERRKTAEILRGLVDHAPAAIGVRDAMGRCLLSNSQYERLVVTSEGQGEADPGSPRPPGGLSPEVLADQTCLRKVRIIEGEEVFAVDGEERIFLSVRYPVVGDEGHAFAVGAIYVEITRQKTTEAELRSTRAELERRAEELNAANIELRELDRLKSEFVASVSHELRTPLTSICGYAEMLTEGDSGDPQGAEQQMIKVIDRNSRRLLSLVEDLLILSAMDSGSFARNDQPVDLGELVDAIRDVLLPTLHSTGVALELDVGQGLPAVLGDRVQLERVLLNLVTNAIKFSDRGGRVTVRARAAGGELAIDVQDSGIGIPAEELSKLFTRFFRTTQARKLEIPGAGLGLAVVREIVQRHDGRVEVASQPGRGTTVTVRLPVFARDGGGADLHVGIIDAGGLLEAEGGRRR